MSAPIGAVEMAAQAPPAEETSDGDWSMQGPYTFDHWRDMIERQAPRTLQELQLKVGPLLRSKIYVVSPKALKASPT